ncbi:hypothetical protein [Kribbella sp. NPDC004536]|uniref:hypothetical protein n=1 Tax=Kribbella sp. NPDC004536 TaxID=3364106 RepID=UPI0036B22E7F
MREWRELTRRALGELAHGRLTPAVGQPLSAATDAHTAIEDRRTRGKALLVTRT